MKCATKLTEPELNIKSEKEKVEKLRFKLDGMEYCEDCKKWVYPSHFDEK